jgi:hypothetical protein
MQVNSESRTKNGVNSHTQEDRAESKLASNTVAKGSHAIEATTAKSPHPHDVANDNKSRFARPQLTTTIKNVKTTSKYPSSYQSDTEETPCAVHASVNAEDGRTKNDPKRQAVTKRRHARVNSQKKTELKARQQQKLERPKRRDTEESKTGQSSFEQVEGTTGDHIDESNG